MSDGTQQDQGPSVQKSSEQSEQVETDEARQAREEAQKKARFVRAHREMYGLALIGVSMNQNESPQVIANRADLIATAAANTLLSKET